CLGPCDARPCRARDPRVRPYGREGVLCRARLRSDNDVPARLGRTQLPTEGDPGHGVRVCNRPSAGLRRFRGRQERGRQGARTAGLHHSANQPRHVENVRPVGRLLSVNVGLPKDVSWRGKTVFTGVYKDPVSGPRHVGRLNVDGDGQGDRAGHGGEERAGFVYQLESYRYWERELGRDDFAHGQFGENFTIEGLPDDEVCIGDRYQIGSGVFEVTQPRVTCYRVGIRMDDPRIPALLVSHRRPGFYLRVLEEGDVQAGDGILKLATGLEEMTVAEVDGLLYLPGHERRQLLRALRIPALGPGWRASFRALLEATPEGGNAGFKTASPPAAWAGFRRLTVAGV